MAYLDDATLRSLDDQVTRCVAVRDAGDLRGAADALAAIVERAPGHLRATLELLLIAITAQLTDVPDRLLAGMPMELQAHPHIRLMLAHHSLQRGKLNETLAWLVGVSNESVAGVPTFAVMRRNLLGGLTAQLFDLTAPIAALMPSLAMEQARFGLVEAILQDIIDTEEDPQELFLQLQRWTFLTPDQLHLRVDVFGRLLSRLPDHAPTQILTTAFAYLVATRSWREAEAMANRLFVRAEILQDPVFAKWLTALSTEGNRQLEQIAAQFVTACAIEWAKPEQPNHGRAVAKLNAIEVGSRQLRRELRPAADFAAIGALAPTYSARPREAGLHFYVGVFGQMRFGQYVLGPLADYLRDQLALFVARGARVSFGVSTWEESGQRELTERDGYAFLQDLLPQQIDRQLLPRGLLSVGQAAALLPTITRRLIEDGRHTQIVDAGMLRALFHPDAFVAIARDADFQKEFGEQLAAAMGGSVPLINQGRMWSRIAAHRELVQQAEQQAGRPVTHAILLRGDLTALSGPLASYIATRVMAGRDNWAIFDHDPHASFIEGVGDRYMVMDRLAFDRVMDGYDLLRSIVAPGSPVDPAYRVRFFPHTHLRTILFEHGTEIHEILRAVVQFDIFRGRRTLEQLAPEIAEDAVISADPLIRAFLRSLSA